MRHVETPRFETDVQALPRAHALLFVRVVADRFNPAAERVSRELGAPWPASLRVKRVVGAPGVWQMTWSFTGPDGRATFEWVDIQGERGIRWRRVGGHAIFRDP